MKNNSLVGIYDLLSWENRHESGKITYPLGPVFAQRGDPVLPQRLVHRPADSAVRCLAPG